MALPKGPDLDKFTRHYWACAKCGCKNELEHFECEFCKTGVNPEDSRDKQHDQNFKLMVITFLASMLLSGAVLWALNDY